MSNQTTEKKRWQKPKPLLKKRGKHPPFDLPSSPIDRGSASHRLSPVAHPNPRLTHPDSSRFLSDFTSHRPEVCSFATVFHQSQKLVAIYLNTATMSNLPHTTIPHAPTVVAPQEENPEISSHTVLSQCTPQHLIISLQLSPRNLNATPQSLVLCARTHARGRSKNETTGQGSSRFRQTNPCSRSKQDWWTPKRKTFRGIFRYAVCFGTLLSVRWLVVVFCPPQNPRMGILDVRMR